MQIDIQEIVRLRERKLITTRPHPTADLIIANYAPQVQFDKLWGESYLLPSCRGLIFDHRGNVVARPFDKFFNYGEYTGPIPDSPYEVTEKMDGSLGILYWTDRGPAIATRGSFTSEQAIEGTRILRDKYGFVGLGERFGDDRYTYLFEIIYPENRIVVNYGPRRDLVLLGVVDNETGRSLPWTDEALEQCRFPTPQRWDGHSLDELKAKEIDNFEGFVVHWPETGLRLKVKLEEYLRLHKVLTGVSTRTIWQALKNGDNIQTWIENVPDEFAEFIKSTVANLRVQFWVRDGEVKEAFTEVMSHFKGFAYPDRKQFAAQATKYECRDILFLMFDSRSYTDRIWKELYPAADAPAFKVEGSYYDELQEKGNEV